MIFNWKYKCPKVLFFLHQVHGKRVAPRLLTTHPLGDVVARAVRRGSVARA